MSSAAFWEFTASRTYHFRFVQHQQKIDADNRVIPPFILFVPVYFFFFRFRFAPSAACVNSSSSSTTSDPKNSNATCLEVAVTEIVCGNNQEYKVEFLTSEGLGEIEAPKLGSSSVTLASETNYSTYVGIVNATFGNSTALKKRTVQAIVTDPQGATTNCTYTAKKGKKGKKGTKGTKGNRNSGSKKGGTYPPTYTHSPTTESETAEGLGGNYDSSDSKTSKKSKKGKSSVVCVVFIFSCRISRMDKRGRSEIQLVALAATITNLAPASST